MKLPSDAWNQPEGVSDATWQVYDRLYEYEIMKKIEESRAYGIQITVLLAINLHNNALRSLLENKPKNVEETQFDMDVKLLAAQIKKNCSMYKSRATSLRNYNSKQAAMKTMQKNQEQAEKTGPRL